MFLMVGKPRRIVAGEAGVAMLRLRLVAYVLAERTIETVDREKGKAVGVDIVGHLGDIHLRGEQLRPLRCVDAVEAAMSRRRGGNPHVDLDRKSTRLNSSH